MQSGQADNARITYPVQGNNAWKQVLMPHKCAVLHGKAQKVERRQGMGSRLISWLVGQRPTKATISRRSGRADGCIRIVIQSGLLYEATEEGIAQWGKPLMRRKEQHLR